MYLCITSVPTEVTEGSDCPWNWSYRCESHHMGVENCTQILCKSSQCP